MADEVPHKRYPSVPDGWFDYLPYGDRIRATKIVPVKTPLKKSFNNGQLKAGHWRQPVDYECGVCIEDEFTPQQMVEGLAEKGLMLTAVIDLTFTNRYYNSSEFDSLGVKHSKVKCPGQVVPSDPVYNRFCQKLKQFLGNCKGPDDVVAIHCTHGLNRTGYLICRYLMEEMRFSADDAITEFNRARGYNIERETYIEHLMSGCPSHPSSSCRTVETPQSWRQPNEHAPHVNGWYSTQNQTSRHSQMPPHISAKRDYTHNSSQPWRHKDVPPPICSRGGPSSRAWGRSYQTTSQRHKFHTNSGLPSGHHAPYPHPSVVHKFRTNSGLPSGHHAPYPHPSVVPYPHPSVVHSPYRPYSGVDTIPHNYYHRDSTSGAWDGHDLHSDRSYPRH